MHPRPVGIEYTHDPKRDTVLAGVGGCEGLAATLALVVAGAVADRVDLAPIGLRLWVLFGLAVDLAGRGDQQAGADGLREPKHVQRALDRGQDGPDPIPLIMDGRRWA